MSHIAMLKAFGRLETKSVLEGYKIPYNVSNRMISFGMTFIVD